MERSTHMPAQMSWCLPRASQKTKHITTPNVQEISVRCGLSVHLSHLSVFLFCTNRIKSLSSEMILLVPVCAVLSRFSRVRLFATLWTVARQAPLSMRFSRQNTGVGCHAPLQGMFLSEIEPTSLTSPASAGGFFTTSTTWEALSRCLVSIVSVQRAYCVILLIPQKKRPSLPLWMQESGGSESLSDLPEVRNRYKSLSLD